METPCPGIIEVERTFGIRVSRLTGQVVGETVSAPRSVGTFIVYQEEKPLVCYSSTAFERILVHSPDRNDTTRFDIVQTVESRVCHTITGGCTGRETVVKSEMVALEGNDTIAVFPGVDVSEVTALRYFDAVIHAVGQDTDGRDGC